MAFGSVLGGLGAVSGRSWDGLGPVLVGWEEVLGVVWGGLGESWDVLGGGLEGVGWSPWGPWERSWGCLGGLRAAFGAIPRVYNKP